MQIKVLSKNPHTLSYPVAVLHQQELQTHVKSRMSDSFRIPSHKSMQREREREKGSLT